jgi:hypothetical protein
MTNGVFVTGALIVAITIVGTFAVSCSGETGQNVPAQGPGR